MVWLASGEGKRQGRHDARSPYAQLAGVFCFYIWSIIDLSK